MATDEEIKKALQQIKRELESPQFAEALDKLGEEIEAKRIKWELIETIGEYRFWKYQDGDGRTVYNATKDDNPPTGEGGYYSYGYLLKVKGLLPGPTVGKILGGQRS